MKNLIAKEFMYFFIALIVALPIGFLFLNMIQVEPATAQMTESEKVIEMDMLFIGGLLGFIGVYLIRLTVWAVKQLLISE